MLDCMHFDVEIVNVITTLFNSSFPQLFSKFFIASFNALALSSCVATSDLVLEPFTNASSPDFAHHLKILIERFLIKFSGTM